VLTRAIGLPPSCGAVWADEAQTVDLALSHLWELGHRRIAHIAGPTETDDIALRRRDAFESWTHGRGVFDPALVARGGSWEGGADLGAVLAGWRSLTDPPTAVFCANDALAVALVDAARRAGLSVPGDVSVVGVDNSPAAMECRPPLTSVNMAMEQVGRESVRCLLRLLRGDPLGDCRTELPVASLVERASTAPPGAIK